MKYTKGLFLFISLFVFTSCYHAQITTDRSPSDQSIERPWAHSFIYGLVPPKIVETASECPNGLAKVQTKMSFLNGLVSGLTFGIYTPINIKVTCASGTAAVEASHKDNIVVSANSNEKEKKEAFTKASKKSKDTESPVYITFR